MLTNFIQLAAVSLALTLSGCFLGSDDDDDGPDCVTTCDSDRSSCVADCDDDSCQVDCDTDFDDCESDCD